MGPPLLGCMSDGYPLLMIESIDSSDNLRRTKPIVPWSILQAIHQAVKEGELGSFVVVEQLGSFLSQRSSFFVPERLQAKRAQ